MENNRFAPFPDVGMPVRAVEIKVSEEVARRKVTQWVNKQGRLWPKELTSQHLMENMKLCYFPSWLVQGWAGGDWTGEGRKSTSKTVEARVSCGTCNGTGKYRFDNNGILEVGDCYTCGGSGVVDGTKQEKSEIWVKRRGYVDSKLRVLYSARDDSLGETVFMFPEINPKKLVDPRGDVPILRSARTESTYWDEIKKGAARQGLMKQLEKDHRDGSVRNARLYNIEIEKLTIQPIMYPVYSSTFEHKGEALDMVVDAALGKVVSGIPEVVSNKRGRNSLLGVVFLFLLAAFMVVVVTGFFWAGMKFPRCAANGSGCINYGFTTLLLLATWLVSSGVHERIGINTWTQKLKSGLVLAAPVAVALLLTPFPDSNFTFTHRLIAILIAFAAGASSLGVFQLTLCLFMLVNGVLVHLGDSFALPIMALACVGQILFDDNAPTRDSKSAKPAEATSS